MIDKSRKFDFDAESTLEDIFYRENDGINVTEFQDCCGASIIYGFPILTEESIAHSLRDSWLREFDDYLDDIYPKKVKRPKQPNFKEIISDYILFAVTNVIQEIKSGHLHFIILNDTQNWIGKYLRQKGFRLVSNRTVNSNSDQRLHVYLLDPENKKGKSTKRMFQ